MNERRIGDLCGLDDRQHLSWVVISRIPSSAADGVLPEQSLALARSGGAGRRRKEAAAKECHAEHSNEPPPAGKTDKMAGPRMHHWLHGGGGYGPWQATFRLLSRDSGTGVVEERKMIAQSASCRTAQSRTR